MRSGRTSVRSRKTMRTMSWAPQPSRKTAKAWGLASTCRRRSEIASAWGAHRRSSGGTSSGKGCRTTPGSARLPSARDLSALPLRRLPSARGKASWRSANAAGRASRPRAIGREPVRGNLIPHRCGKGGRICRGIASPLPVAPNSPCRRPEAHGPRLSLRVRARRPCGGRQTSRRPGLPSRQSGASNA